ncbi:RNA polymerase sigma factor [Kutzneria sp. CA-103260]|uniref:RNA polymerase sigma factor n=1 Tax=Kutzneria sp. CA-103260 TaxID=2802641 RepID=UPI001BA7AE51|nr:DUF6596 domain-containing protein [Kutzneria sp. CA-103260]QUQ69370.1 RNA polymerase subunit sigma-24 [Kutzneria sp. CA-103260]
MTSGFEDLLRELTPQVLAAVVRRYGHFDTAEDAVQEALLTAAQQWPADGVPDNPKAWLITVASRRLTDLLRGESARQRRESTWTLPEHYTPAPTADDSLVLLFLCCHPSLSPSSQIALTLRAVGGLTTAEIARAFLVPESTMTRRISRAKQTVKASGVPFGLPADDRLPVVLHVLYLIFTEGYARDRVELSGEAIRLARMVRRLRPDDGEAAGLLALLLLTDARRPARTGPNGEPVPMAEQDRTRWLAEDIAEGVDLVTTALTQGPPGPYQLQAAIAAVHDEAASYAETDWPQIVGLYELLQRISDNPVVDLNHAVAVAMVDGPRKGLALLDNRLDDDHRLHSARAHLLELAGDRAAARVSYREASRRATSLPQQRYLNARADRLMD